MPRKKAAPTEAPTAAPVKLAAVAAGPARAERRFAVEDLAPHCRELFGVSTCVFAGATAGLTDRYTVMEMKALIKDWSEKEIE